MANKRTSKSLREREKTVVCVRASGVIFILIIFCTLFNSTKIQAHVVWNKKKEDVMYAICFNINWNFTQRTHENSLTHTWV